MVTAFYRENRNSIQTFRLILRRIKKKKKKSKKKERKKRKWKKEEKRERCYVIFKDIYYFIFPPYFFSFLSLFHINISNIFYIFMQLKYEQSLRSRKDQFAFIFTYIYTNDFSSVTRNIMRGRCEFEIASELIVANRHS